MLPTGHACALQRPPGSALGMALHALSLLTHSRLIADIELHRDDAKLIVHAAAVSALDRSDRLRARPGAYRALYAGRARLPRQRRRRAPADPHAHASPRPSQIRTARRGTKRPCHRLGESPSRARVRTRSFSGAPIGSERPASARNSQTRWRGTARTICTPSWGCSTVAVPLSSRLGSSLLSTMIRADADGHARPRPDHVDPCRGCRPPREPRAWTPDVQAWLDRLSPRVATARQRSGACTSCFSRRALRGQSPPHGVFSTCAAATSTTSHIERGRRARLRLEQARRPSPREPIHHLGLQIRPARGRRQGSVVARGKDARCHSSPRAGQAEAQSRPAGMREPKPS